MALTRIFGGTTLYVPGAYTTKNVILTGSVPSIAVGKIAIVGEATKGRPGSVEVLQFTPQALSDLESEYGSGPIVDAARAIFNPSNDGRIAQGASSLYIFKTNDSSKSSLALADSWGQLDSEEYGEEANLVYAEIQKEDATDASAQSSSSFDATGPDFASGNTFKLRIMGGIENEFTCPAGITTAAALESALQNASNWSGALPSGISFSVSGTDSVASLSISLDVDLNDHRYGYGRTFELIAGASDFLALVNISAGLFSAQIEPSERFIFGRQSDEIVEDSDESTGDIGGSIYLEIEYLGTSAELEINSTQLIATVVGGAGSSLSLTLSNFRTINDIATYINSQAGYKCRVPQSVNGALSPTILDRVSSMGFASGIEGRYPGKVKADAWSVFDYARRNSTLISIPNTGSRVGLPDPISQTFLSGAQRGSSSNSDFLDALSAFEEIEDIDIIVPLVSQDASDDLAEDVAYTDSGSSYTVDSIHLAVKNHCKKMSGTKFRKERVCYLGKRESFSECINASRSISSEFASMLIQDVSVLGSDGNLFWGQPHLAASLCAAMQAGGDIGQPTTKKLINALGVRHVLKQGITPSSTEKFSPKTKLDQAIEAGIMPLNDPSSGGIEIVVQNATYSRDANFVYNRPSVFEAMNYMAKVIRISTETKFAGTKNSTTTPESIKTEIIALMSDFLRSDIVVGDDTNEGLGFKNLTIRADGNAVFIDITVTPVQGVDFILTNLKADNTRISA